MTPKKHPMVEFLESVRKGREKHSLTYSAWLRYVKKIPENEISINMDNSDKLSKEYEEWLKVFTEYELKLLKQIYDVVYPIQRVRTVVHFKYIKRKLMKVFKMDRWDIDKFLFRMLDRTFDGQTHAFYLSMCGSRCSSRLHYISRAKQGTPTNFSNSYCYIQFDDRNKYTKMLMETRQC